MKISGKYFRSLNRILAAAGSAERVRFSVLLDDIPTELRVTLGFDESQNVGDYLVPSVIGKYTSFNANGDVKVRKDLSKRPESIMFYGASRDWRGGVHYGVKNTHS